MLKIKNVKIYGLNESLIRSGYPMITDATEILQKIEDCSLDESDLKRGAVLSKHSPGTGHNNMLKGIIVQFDLKYSGYFTPQLQRYHWIDIISSMSKMHRLTKQKLDENNCNKYVSDLIMSVVNGYINDYNQNQTYENYMKVISNCPMGFEMWMGISTNYLQLKTVYLQRKEHKLKEDWGYFCDWIKTLPKSEIITKEGNNA